MKYEPSEERDVLESIGKNTPVFEKRRPGYFFRRGKDENEKQIKNYINNLYYFFIYTDSVQQ
ncbi:hypothetical protein TSYNTROOL_06450 [Tepidanaerobacter syntrophicus]|nr:hypothetical protein TSYNTROOL_06450 [Tepidanaerobacter syntrophicus]